MYCLWQPYLFGIGFLKSFSSGRNMLECVWCTFQFVDVHSRVWSGLGSGRKWEQGGSGQADPRAELPSPWTSSSGPSSPFMKNTSSI